MANQQLGFDTPLADLFRTDAARNVFRSFMDELRRRQGLSRMSDEEYQAYFAQRPQSPRREMQGQTIGF